MRRPAMDHAHTLALNTFLFAVCTAVCTATSSVTAADAAQPVPGEPSLSGTNLLTAHADFAADMVAGIDRWLNRKLADCVDQRASRWRPDYSSREAYVASVAPHRMHLARIIGAVDERIVSPTFEIVSSLANPGAIASTDTYNVFAVRWPVLPGVDGEGLLLEPKAAARACVIAIPDADQTPEMLTGLVAGLPAEQQFARRLAENGCRVIVPVLIDRTCEWSGDPRQFMTNQTHREWIYRMSFEAGRHIIGYEVQKVLAAIDALEESQPAEPLPIGIAGYGEGGLIAFYAGALSSRIEATLVSGYFRRRQGVWQEPVYHNVWQLLREFGDAEIAWMIAPRAFIVEAGRGPEIAGPPQLQGHEEAAPGVLVTPPLECVKAEFERVAATYAALGTADRLALVEAGDQGPGTEPALSAFLAGLGMRDALRPSTAPPQDLRGSFAPKPRLHRQFDQLVEYTQKLLRDSHFARREFWSKADTSSPDKWAESCVWYRDYLYEEVIGRAEPASVPANPRTRQILDEPKFTGYEVQLDVWPEVFAYGVLLLPKNLKAGERRPVVVCQHGLEGTPDVVVNPRTTSLYHSFGARLADEGFIVFAPQNPYKGGESFRILQRKANPLGLSLFSVIARQHERILEWLTEQPFVDAKRIGFYGISYGGRSAMRLPALLPQYALSICSADFNEYVFKVAGSDYPFGFMFVNEYEMPEFNLANTFNHAELAGLIAPRPFMVERGHNDPVAADEWVGYEYAKVRRLYAKLGIPELTEIEYSNGGHEIHGVGTFAFLHRNLHYPAP